MPFNLLLLVLGLYYLTDCALAQNDSSSQERCKQFKAATVFRGWSVLEPSKCLNQTYMSDHQVAKFKDACSVEPQDESLSYIDCVWTFYKCIVEKSLGSIPLTLTSYADFMSGNLSDPIKEAIVSVLQTNQSGNETELQHAEEGGEEFLANTTTVNSKLLIEEYWNSYFDAEFEVCANGSINTCSEKDLKIYRSFWSRQKRCRNGYIPVLTSILAYTYNRTQCYSFIKSRHGSTNNTRMALSFAMSLWCDGIAHGMIKEQDENVILDFEQVYTNTITPGYYSKSVKRDAFKLFQTRFAQAYSNCNDTIAEAVSAKEIFNCALQHEENELRKKGHTEENLIFLTNTHLLENLLELSYSIPRRLCYPEPYKRS